VSTVPLLLPPVFFAFGGKGKNRPRRLSKLVSGPEGGPAFTAAGFAEAIRTIQDTLGSQALRDAGISGKELALAALKDQVTSPEARRTAMAVMGRLEQMLANQGAVAEDKTAVFIENGRPISAAAPQA
jgi:hypothetical protein